ncbi:hypothetical protein QR77_33845 [Streptomyces sp. 150FB]|uniref:hypothetical protein n=1 Tax=Streptomyces sp. 150FB TaxID=1576605 RepID=UPI0005891E28|nr:hypothetical protein [Streptomyces sp. 150FB]KIF77489.1 hypothetical protein QR77_33845 [Streptomyces sp. 150FB]
MSRLRPPAVLIPVVLAFALTGGAPGADPGAGSGAGPVLVNWNAPLVWAATWLDVTAPLLANR